MREVIEPQGWTKFSDNNMKAMSPATSFMNGLKGVFSTFDQYLVVENKKYERPRPYRGLAKPKSRRASDVVRYLWEEAQYSEKPLDPVERIVDEYADDCVFGDLTYKDEVWPRGKEAFRKFQQETFDE